MPAHAAGPGMKKARPLFPGASLGPARAPDHCRSRLRTAERAAARSRHVLVAEVRAARVRVRTAARGATGIDVGVLRLDRLAAHPDDVAVRVDQRLQRE